jgi:hypothetical protein
MTGRAPVEYADTSRRGGEAVQSLARFLGVGEATAAAVLASPAEYRREIRSRMTPQQRMRELERRYAPPAA